MSVSRFLLQLEQRAIAAETLIATLKHEITQLENKNQASASLNQLGNLKKENDALKNEVEVWKQKLLQIGLNRGVQHCSISSPNSVEDRKPVEKSQKTTAEVSSTKNEKSKIKEEKKKSEPSKKVDSSKSEEDEKIDIGRVDLRIGKIVSVKKHPDADSLYVEEVDLGEGKHRTVVSGLVKHVPIEEMMERVAVFMCNLKPAKMRGITSEGMLMCASTPDKVEILCPPSGASPGDLVHVDGYVRRPDAVMNPKKKIWETVAPDLKTNEEKLATYRGAVLTIPSKGPITAPTLANVPIK